MFEIGVLINAERDKGNRKRVRIICNTQAGTMTIGSSVCSVVANPKGHPPNRLKFLSHASEQRQIDTSFVKEFRTIYNCDKESFVVFCLLAFGKVHKMKMSIPSTFPNLYCWLAAYNRMMMANPSKLSLGLFTARHTIQKQANATHPPGPDQPG